MYARVLTLLSRKCPGADAWFGRYRQPIVYLIVGGFSGVIHLSVAFLLVHYFDVPPARASLAGFISANPFSYLGHKLVTFMVPGRDVFEVARFVITALVGLSLASAVPYVLVDLLRQPALAAFCVVVTVIPIANFLALRFWVFARGSAT